MHKTLLKIYFSEVYQDILQPEENFGWPEVLKKYDNSIVSDTVIRYLIPIHVRLITKRHKVTRDCETFISDKCLD